MSTSGITVFQLTRDDIINAALRKLLVLGYGLTADAIQLANGAQALNAVVASFQSQGMALWARKELPITLVVGKQDYTIGVGQELNVPFPLHIQQAILTIPPAYSQIDVNVLSRTDFNTLTLKAISGTPVNSSYQPFINYGTFSVWPVPDASLISGSVITITYTSPFEYFIASTDTMDFPQEWYMAVIYSLAAALAPEYGIPLQDRQMFSQEAATYLATALANGTEDGSIFFAAG